MNTKRHRVAIVASHVIQYQDPFFRLLASEPEIDLTVFYLSEAGARRYRDAEMNVTMQWDIDMLSGYRHVFLRNFAIDPSGGYARHINPGIVPALARGGFDAVIFMLGWGSISSLLGILACRVAGVPLFLYGDSSFPPPENSIARRFRAGLLKILFAQATGFMVSGKLNAEYYAHYGANRERFFLLPWAVDNERFEQGARFATGEREALRARHGIAPEDVVFVYSAKLVERKDPLTLLSAFEQMHHRRRAVVVYLGDGPMRPDLEAYVRDRQLDRVRLLGFVNQRDLPRHYAMGDVFVLPSLVEPRGAVINEAMACGLPVIVTDRCGSIGDIVQEGENALIYRAGDAAELAAALDHLVENPALRERMGERSREIVRSWDFRRGVEGVKEMLRWLDPTKR